MILSILIPLRIPRPSSPPSFSKTALYGRFTISTEPILRREHIPQHRVAIHMAAIKFTHITYQQHILIISPIAFITHKIVKLIVLEFLLFNFNDLSFLLNFLLAVDFDFNVFFKFCAATWTVCGGFCPLLNALAAEFVAAAKDAANAGPLVEANCTYVVVSL